MTPSRQVLDDVRRYYDRNTPAFARFGQGRGAGAIHRAVWGDGVTSRENAFRYVDELVLREIEALAPGSSPLHVLDLGCGLGASLVFLGLRAPIHGTGVTLSEVQAARAAGRIREAGLEDRVRCLAGSFLDLPPAVPPARAAFSIEAFVHGPDPAAYFAAAARYLLPGGILMVCDDFLTERAARPLSTKERRYLQDFRRGWLVNTLITAAEARTLAARSGFELVRDIDLTPHLELRRPRDRVLTALVAIGRPLHLTGYRWLSLLGGSALQSALGAGLLSYRFMTWRRLPTP